MAREGVTNAFVVFAIEIYFAQNSIVVVVVAALVVSALANCCCCPLAVFLASSLVCRNVEDAPKKI